MHQTLHIWHCDSEWCQWEAWRADAELRMCSLRQCLWLQKVKATENVHKKYQKQLLAEKVVSEDDLKRMQEHVSGIMSKEFEAARDYKPEVLSQSSGTVTFCGTSSLRNVSKTIQSIFGQATLSCCISELSTHEHVLQYAVKVKL